MKTPAFPRVEKGRSRLAGGPQRPYSCGVRKFATGLLILAFLAGSVALANASGWGGGKTHKRGAASVQYKLKPGCGPDKTDGVAGSSGRHVGQPPKDQNRGDCPNPSGQNNGSANKTGKH